MFKIGENMENLKKIELNLRKDNKNIMINFWPCNILISKYFFL